MRPKTPTLEQLASIADEYRLHLSEGELDQFRALMPTTLGSYERIAAWLPAGTLRKSPGRVVLALLNQRS